MAEGQPESIQFNTDSNPPKPVYVNDNKLFNHIDEEQKKNPGVSDISEKKKVVYVSIPDQTSIQNITNITETLTKYKNRTKEYYKKYQRLLDGNPQMTKSKINEYFKNLITSLNKQKDILINKIDNKINKNNFEKKKNDVIKMLNENIKNTENEKEKCENILHKTFDQISNKKKSNEIENISNKICSKFNEANKTIKCEILNLEKILNNFETDLLLIDFILNEYLHKIITTNINKFGYVCFNNDEKKEINNEINNNEYKLLKLENEKLKDEKDVNIAKIISLENRLKKCDYCKVFKNESKNDNCEAHSKNVINVKLCPLNNCGKYIIDGINCENENCEFNIEDKVITKYNCCAGDKNSQGCLASHEYDDDDDDEDGNCIHCDQRQRQSMFNIFGKSPCIKRHSGKVINYCPYDANECDYIIQDNTTIIKCNKCGWMDSKLEQFDIWECCQLSSDVDKCLINHQHNYLWIN